MKILESLAQTVEDVKAEVVKDIFKKGKTTNAEELLRAKCPRSEWLILPFCLTTTQPSLFKAFITLS